MGDMWTCGALQCAVSGRAAAAAVCLALLMLRSVPKGGESSNSLSLYLIYSAARRIGRDSDADVSNWEERLLSQFPY